VSLIPSLIPSAKGVSGCPLIPSLPARSPSLGGMDFRSTVSGPGRSRASIAARVLDALGPFGMVSEPSPGLLTHAGRNAAHRMHVPVRDWKTRLLRLARRHQLRPRGRSHTRSGCHLACAGRSAHGLYSSGDCGASWRRRSTDGCARSTPSSSCRERPRQPIEFKGACRSSVRPRQRLSKSPSAVRR
jgi:hypothetical protein